MPDPKKNPARKAVVGSEREPESRLRIKPQTLDRNAARQLLAEALLEKTSEAMEQLAADAEANNWSREEIVDRVLAIKMAAANEMLSEEDRAAFTAQARVLFLKDPRFRQ